MAIYNAPLVLCTNSSASSSQGFQGRVTRIELHELIVAVGACSPTYNSSVEKKATH